VGYYPNAGHTQIVVQVGLVNNLAIGPNASAAQGANTAAVSGTLSTNALTTEFLMKVLEGNNAALARDKQLQAAVAGVEAAIKNLPKDAPPVHPAVNDATALKLLELVLEQNRAASARADVNNALLGEVIKALTRPVVKSPTAETKGPTPETAPAPMKKPQE